MDNLAQSLFRKKYKSLDSGAVCVAFSSDGKYFASGDRVIKLWNVESGELLQIIEGNSQVKDIAFSPFPKLENNYIVSGNYDNTIKIYNIRIGQQLKLLDGHREDVYALAISQDERLIASGGSGGHIKIWNLENCDLEIQMNGFHTQGVSQMVFCEDKRGNILLISVGGTVVYIWNVSTGEKEISYFGHEKSILCVAYNSKYKQIATGSQDQTIKIWKLPDIEKKKTKIKSKSSNKQDLEPLFTYETPSCVNTVAYSQSGQFLAAGFMDRIVRVYSVQSTYNTEEDSDNDMYEPYIEFNKENIALVDLHKGPILSVTFLPDDRIISAGCDKKIKIWNMDDYGFLESEIEANMGDIKSVVHLPFACKHGSKKINYYYIAAQGTNQQIKLWNMSTYQFSKMPSYTLSNKGHTEVQCYMMASPSGNFLASGGKSLKLWKRKILHVPEQEPQLSYLLDRNISRSQAFYCQGLKFSDQQINDPGPDGELTTSELNILLLSQYSQTEEQ